MRIEDLPYFLERSHSCHIFLIGFPKVGKSTFAHALSNQYRVIDSDLWIEKITKRSRRALLQEEGIFAFREYERRVLKKIMEEPPSIIACGGGIVFVKDIATFFQGHEVLHLRLPMEKIKERVFTPPYPFFIDPDHLEESFLTAWKERTLLYESYQTAELDLTYSTFFKSEVSFK